MQAIKQKSNSYELIKLLCFYVFSSTVSLLAMENPNQDLVCRPVLREGELPKLLVIDDKFPVYTRDFINEEIRALIKSGNFSVSIVAEKVITDHHELEKLPDWMKSTPMQHLKTMPHDLNEYAVIFACWGDIGEKIAQRKHEGNYHGILVTRFRGSPEERIGRPDNNCYSYLKQYGDLYVPNCDFFRKELCGKFGFDAKKFVVHYEAVDVNAIRQMITECKPHTTMEKSISILSICRLEPKKGLGHALKALANIRQVITIPLRYTIIGEGSQRIELEEQIKNLQLDDIVIMTGGKNKKEVIEMLIKSDILLAPSFTADDGDIEGIMNVLKEAGVAGTVVVATDHAGSPELIEDDKTGVLARQNDVDDLTKKLAYAIRNPHRWAEWRNNLKIGVEERFNGLKVYPQLIEILMNTLGVNNNT